MTQAENVKAEELKKIRNNAEEEDKEVAELKVIHEVVRNHQTDGADKMRYGVENTIRTLVQEGLLSSVSSRLMPLAAAVDADVPNFSGNVSDFEAECEELLQSVRNDAVIYGSEDLKGMSAWRYIAHVDRLLHVALEGAEELGCEAIEEMLSEVCKNLADIESRCCEIKEEHDGK